MFINNLVSIITSSEIAMVTQAHSATRLTSAFLFYRCGSRQLYKGHGRGRVRHLQPKPTAVPMAKALEGKKIVIIGGTSGIGFAVAKAALQDRAAEVVVVSSQGINVDGAVDRLQKVVGETAGLVGVVKGEVVDASNPEEVKALFSQARVGEIDHLVWTSTSGGGISSSTGSTGFKFKDTDLDKKRGMSSFPLFSPC